ncbi:LOW QUALITY PROTEIN: hypothetical protein U0070_009660, partial [Myodes glareolus]
IQKLNPSHTCCAQHSVIPVTCISEDRSKSIAGCLSQFFSSRVAYSEYYLLGDIMGCDVRELPVYDVLLLDSNAVTPTLLILAFCLFIIGAILRIPFSPPQGFLHILLAPHLCELVLWLHSLHPLSPKFQSSPEEGHNGVYVVYYFIFHVDLHDPPLILLACSDTHVKKMAMFVVADFILSSSLSIILLSYFYIFEAILRIRSAEGRQKAFSTCSSHLTTV